MLHSRPIDFRTALQRFSKQGDGTGSGDTHLASTIADLLVEAGSMPDRATALLYLLHTAHDSSLVQRMNAAKRDNKKETTMSRMDELRSLVAKSSGGVETLAKMLLDSPAHAARLSEAEYTALVTEQAKREHPTLKAEQAFAKYFGEHETIRRAHALINKAASPYATGPEPSVEKQSDGDASAYNALMEKAAELRAQNPTLSKEQAFAKAYSDPANAELAAAERLGSRPVAGW
jgi:hypothetical protein